MGLGLESRAVILELEMIGGGNELPPPVEFGVTYFLYAASMSLRT